MRFEILWNGNSIADVNTFRSQKCKLCEAERLYLVSEMYGRNKSKLMNKADEIFGPCRHKASFHKYLRTGGIDYTHITLMSDSDDAEKDQNETETDPENSEVEANWFINNRQNRTTQGHSQDVSRNTNSDVTSTSSNSTKSSRKKKKKKDRK